MIIINKLIEKYFDFLVELNAGFLPPSVKNSSEQNGLWWVLYPPYLGQFHFWDPRLHYFDDMDWEMSWNLELANKQEKNVRSILDQLYS